METQKPEKQPSPAKKDWDKWEAEGGDSQPTVDFLTGNQRSDNSADTKAQNQGSEEETSKGLSDQNVNQIARRQLIHLVNIWLNLDEDTRSAVMTLIGDQT